MSNTHTASGSTPVELLYVWTECDESGFIREQGFNFSPHYRFELKATEDGVHYELSGVKNTAPPNVWDFQNIVNLTAVVGENGSGKSSLLRHLLCSPLLPGLSSSGKQSGDGPKMMKIYRVGNKVRICHNFPDGEITYGKDFKIKEVEKPGDFFMPDSQICQTRVYMTNGYGAADLIRESVQDQNSIYFSPEENTALSRLFFEKTANAGEFRDFAEFSFLQKRIAGHNRYRDFEQFAVASYYHHLLSEQKKDEETPETDETSETEVTPETEDSTTKLIATCNQKMIVTLNNPYDWFKDMELGSAYRPDSYYKEILVKTLQDFEEWNSKYLEEDPFNAIILAFDFELDFMTRYLLDGINGNPAGIDLGSKHPAEYMGILLQRYSEAVGHNNSVLKYYRTAKQEIERLASIWFGCRQAHVYASNKSAIIKWGIEIHRDEDEVLYKEFCEYIHDMMRETSSFALKYLSISMPPRSSGEQALQNVFSWLKLPPSYQQILGQRSVPIEDNVLLLLDEVDLYMHPEWQRQFLKLLSDRLNQEYRGKKIQVIVTTHSPLVLSDIPSRSIIYLRNEGEKCRIVQGPELKETFGANLFALLKDSFFLKKSLGDFAFCRIQKMISDLNELKSKPRDTDLQDRCRGYDQLIDIIGEPLIRRRLQRLYREAFRADAAEKHSRYLEEFNRLQASDKPDDQKKYQALLAMMGLGSNDG